MTVQTTTDELWYVNGVPLNTYAYNIKTFGDSRLGVPSLRGEGIQFAYRPGQRFRPKTPDSRVISLNMWVLGFDPEDDGAAPGSDRALAFNDNWNGLRRLFWDPDAEFSLTKKWWVTVDSTPTLVEATAQAQYSGGLEPSMTGRTRADFTVDLLLSDPFFYGTTVDEDVDLGATVTINNPGDAKTYYTGLTVDLVGTSTLTNPVLRNASTNPDLVVWVQGSYGGTTTLDIPNFKIYPASIPLNLVGHSGARSWFGLVKGDNVVSLVGSGSGKAVIHYKPVYL